MDTIRKPSYTSSPPAAPSPQSRSARPSRGFSPQKSRILLQLALTQTTDLDSLREIFSRY